MAMLLSERWPQRIAGPWTARTRPRTATTALPAAGPWGWGRARLLLSQARFRAERIQAATNWALITTAVFLACTAVLLLAR